jgi:threonine/homoserine/homoserine lactone efflux protein
MAGLLMFVAALTVAYLVPGPDMMLVLQTGALQGRSRAIATAGGLALARSAHVGLAGFGLAALFASTPWAFDVVRFMGAAYLVWLGIGILRAPSLLPTTGPASGDMPHAPSHGAVFRRGLLTNILNPKALLFCSVLLPQFIRPETGSVQAQFLVLGVILVGVGFAFDLLYSFVGSAIGALLLRYPVAAILQKWLFGSVLVAFGVRLAASQ